MIDALRHNKSTHTLPSRHLLVACATSRSHSQHQARGIVRHIVPSPIIKLVGKLDRGLDVKLVFVFPCFSTHLEGPQRCGLLAAIHIVAGMVTCS